MDRNNSIKELSKKTGLSEARLRALRRDPEQLKKTAWINVYRLAQIEPKNPYLQELDKYSNADNQ
ncbi:hypothetical protein AB9M75_06115 [Lactobacillus sp. AN1001]